MLAAAVQVIYDNIGLPQEMYNDGYANITNIDISASAIRLMEELNRDLPDTIKCYSLLIR